MDNARKTRAPKVDRKMFDACKILFDGGATIYEVSKFTNLSETTAKRIKRADTFEEYQAELTAMCLEQRKRSQKKKEETEKKPEPEPVKAEQKPVEVKEIRQSITMQTTHYVETKIDIMIDLLKNLNAKLAFVVDELTGVPVKKG